MEEKINNNLANKPKLPPKPIPPKRIPPKAPPVKQDLKEETISDENENLKQELNSSQESSNNQNIKNEKNVNNKTKEKKEKQKPKKKNKKKLILILLIIFAVIGIASGITAGVLINNENNKKLQTPTLEIVKLKDSVMLNSSVIEKSTKYEFVVTSDSGSKSYFHDSAEFELPKEANQPGEYSFKVRVHGKGPGATSDFSEVKTLKNYKKLESPSINVEGLNNILKDQKIIGYKTDKDSLANDYLTWQKIENASSYKIYYGVDFSSGEGVPLVDEYKPKISETTIRYKLSNIFDKAGLYTIFVVAVPSAGTHYEQSDEARVKNIEFYSKQDKVINASYTRATKVLTFSLNINAKVGNEFDLYINNKTKPYKIYDSFATKVKNEQTGLYDYTVYLSDPKIDVEITDLVIVTPASGAYSSDSDPTFVDLN